MGITILKENIPIVIISIMAINIINQSKSDLFGFRYFQLFLLTELFQFGRGPLNFYIVHHVTYYEINGLYKVFLSRKN